MWMVFLLFLVLATLEENLRLNWLKSLVFVSDSLLLYIYARLQVLVKLLRKFCVMFDICSGSLKSLKYVLSDIKGMSLILTAL